MKFNKIKIYGIATDEIMDNVFGFCYVNKLIANYTEDDMGCQLDEADIEILEGIEGINFEGDEITLIANTYDRLTLKKGQYRTIEIF